MVARCHSDSLAPVGLRRAWSQRGGATPLSRCRFVGSRASGRIDRFGSDHNPTTRTERAWAAASQPDRQLRRLVTPARPVRRLA
jgi:hypothetical protein